MPNFSPQRRVTSLEMPMNFSLCSGRDINTPLCKLLYREEIRARVAGKPVRQLPQVRQECGQGGHGVRRLHGLSV